MSATATSDDYRSYTVKYNRETRLSYLHDFIEKYSFGTLIYVNPDDQKPTVSHLPFLLRRDQSEEKGTLITHVSRANHLRKLLSQSKQDDEVLVIFQGPHGYISPQWYAPSHIDVPTWNYTSVHVYGKPTLKSVEQAMLDELVAKNELAYASDNGQTAIWNAQEVKEEKLVLQRKAIVEIDIQITKIEGKMKLSQNKDEHVQKQVIKSLHENKNRELAEFMDKYLFPTADTEKEEKRQHISSGPSLENDICYSRAVVDGDWIFVSSCTGYDYHTMKISADVVEQCEQSFRNIEEILKKANSSCSDIVRIRYMLTDRMDFQSCSPVIQKYLGKARPAVTTCQVQMLIEPEIKIEIEVTAKKQKYS